MAELLVYRTVFATIDVAIIGRRMRGDLVFPASSAEVTAPIISNISPAASTPISISQVITFDITDNENLFRRIILKGAFATGWDFIHDGDNFGPNYQGSANTRTVIANGYRYTILRDGGWGIGNPPTITPYVIDEAGNEAA